MNPYQPVDILLVEDNPNDADLTIRALKKHNLASQLMVVQDGAQALDFVFRRGDYEQRSPGAAPRVIFLDINLPKINGLDVLREIKASEDTRVIPVVMVTSSKEDPDIQRAYELGANSYVVKPVVFEAFQQVMIHLGFYWLLVNQGAR